MLNGSEIGGGSVRIHNQEVQRAVFDVLGIGAEEAEQRFGFLLNALKYGCPPLGGIAFGIDRMAALMTGSPVHSRRHRLSQDADRRLPADRRTGTRRRASAQGAGPAAAASVDAGEQLSATGSMREEAQLFLAPYLRALSADASERPGSRSRRFRRPVQWTASPAISPGARTW